MEIIGGLLFLLLNLASFIMFILFIIGMINPSMLIKKQPVTRLKMIKFELVSVFLFIMSFVIAISSGAMTSIDESSIETPDISIENQSTEEKDAKKLVAKKVEKKIDKNVETIMQSTGLSENESIAVFNDLKSVGFRTISALEKGAGDGIDSLQSYMANCDDLRTILTIEKRKTYYIGVQDIDLFSADKGGALDNIGDYILKSGDDIKFITNAKAYVTQILKSPSSAKFPGSVFERDQWTVSRYKDIITVRAYVDADNSFGANIRSPFIVQMSYATDDLLFLAFDNEIMFGEQQSTSK